MEDKVLHILEQVTRLYQRYGIKSVTMDDVASHLCISKKTLYEYFSDKEDLVRQVLSHGHAQHCKIIEEIENRGLNAIEELFEVYKMINTMFRDYNPSMDYDVRKYYPSLYIEVKATWRKKMYDAAFNNTMKGIQEGLYRTEIDAAIIAKMHVARTESLFDSDLFTMEELTSFKIFHEGFVYHLYGILNKDGRSFFESNFGKFKASLD
jgi:TetR/AcrR family transcriptional regulator, cholesterol catabolism regulator